MKNFPGNTVYGILALGVKGISQGGGNELLICSSFAGVLLNYHIPYEPGCGGKTG